MGDSLTNFLTDNIDGPLLTLFVSSFISSTILPGSSEAVLVWVVSDTGQYWLPVLLATLGNTLGGMTTYGLGRVINWQISDDNARHEKARELVQRWGGLSLLFSWLPLIGDGLCLAAGWLRINSVVALIYMALGKFARYYAIAFLII